MPDLGVRLRRFIDAPLPCPLQVPSTASDWLEYAYQHAYADDLASARNAAERGLALEPADDIRLALLGAAVSFDLQLGQEHSAREHLRLRVSLLRSTGQPHLADVETELGIAHFGPVTAPLAEQLRRVAERHRRADMPATVLADIRMPLAIWELENGTGDGLEVLRTCAQAYRGAEQHRSLTDALLALAPALAAAGDLSGALSTVAELLEHSHTPSMRAMALLLKSNILRADGELFPAQHAAFQALELFNEAGIRRGAVSAAALLAELAAEGFDHESAALAWQIAISQAERSELTELWALRLSLGEQLLSSGDCDRAVELLTELAAETETPLQLARILNTLGNASHARADPVAALDAWVRAAGLYADQGMEAGAASILLTAGRLAPAGEPALDAAGLFNRAVQLASRADESGTAVLAHALLARGNELAERGIASGIDDIDTALALARAAGDQQSVARFRAVLATAQGRLGQSRLAIATTLQAAGELTALGLSDESVRAGLLGARLLMASGHIPEAVVRYQMLSEDTEASLELIHEVLQLLGHALELLGRTLESSAAFARADALLTLPGE